MYSLTSKKTLRELLNDLVRTCPNVYGYFNDVSKLKSIKVQNIAKEALISNFIPKIQKLKRLREIAQKGKYFKITSLCKARIKNKNIEDLNKDNLSILIEADMEKNFMQNKDEDIAELFETLINDILAHPILIDDPFSLYVSISNELWLLRTGNIYAFNDLNLIKKENYHINTIRDFFEEIEQIQKHNRFAKSKDDYYLAIYELITTACPRIEILDDIHFKVVSK